ncbi:MAG: hypothetical protein QW063_02745 [Candidatus Nanoarchaeia archaeon]
MPTLGYLLISTCDKDEVYNYISDHIDIKSRIYLKGIYSISNDNSNGNYNVLAEIYVNNSRDSNKIGDLAIRLTTIPSIAKVKTLISIIDEKQKKIVLKQNKRD